MRRKNWTRKEQKTRILTVFAVHQSKGGFGALTARKIGNELDLNADDYVKEICLEMVKEGTLSSVEVIHRIRKDTEVWKTLFNVMNSDGMKKEYENREKQLNLL